MKTLTVTEARKNLSHWLRRAKAGENIGIVDGAEIIALRPVKITSEDYALVEYGVTADELHHFARSMDAELAQDQKKGRSTRFTGRLPRRRAAS